MCCFPLFPKKDLQPYKMCFQKKGNMWMWKYYRRLIESISSTIMADSTAAQTQKLLGDWRDGRWCWRDFHPRSFTWVQCHYVSLAGQGPHVCGPRSRNTVHHFLHPQNSTYPSIASKGASAGKSDCPHVGGGVGSWARPLRSLIFADKKKLYGNFQVTWNLFMVS